MHVLNDPSAADREFQEALAILEEQQTNVLLEGFRAGALDETLAEFDPYDHYIRFLLDRGDSSRAFHVAERQRARAFLDTLSTTRDTLARDVSVKFSNAERQILERIKSAQAILRTDTLDDVSRAELVARVGVYENELTQLRLRLAVERPALAHARYPKLWQVSELQSKLLASDESLLSLYLGANRSVAWIVAPDRLSTITLPPAKDVETFVRAALEELRNPLARDRASLVALSRALSVDRIVKTAQGKRLIVVPHGILYDVPFEALLDDSGRPLVERFAVSYAPSASSLAFLRSAPSRGPAQVSLLGVANPVVAGARLTGKRQVDLTHINLLEPVPHSGDEVRAIAALFGRSARILEGPRATRTELRTAGMEQSRILHFATHGLIDENRPERSGLVLTADPPRDDGLLQMRDIYSLRLNADLVTLSACETALGRHVTGEGIIGLTRAFFYAGAHTVVASLWDVDDAAASRLMQRFYENLHSGQPIDFALQRAKLDFIRAGGPTASPFYWASFVATGNARAAIEVPPASPVPRIAIAAIALLIAGMLSWSAAARRRRGVRKAAASYRTP
jgi:CHAT domain-containing protein